MLLKLHHALVILPHKISLRSIATSTIGEWRSRQGQSWPRTPYLQSSEDHVPQGTPHWQLQLCKPGPLSPASPSLPPSCELPLNGKSDPSQPSGVLRYARAFHVVTPLSLGPLRESSPNALILQIKRWQQRRLKHSYGVTGRARILTHPFCPVSHASTIWWCHTTASDILLAPHHQQSRVHRPTRVYWSLSMTCPCSHGLAGPWWDSP